MERAGVAYVHIGTPKTGTTSIQAFLGANEARLRSVGIALPRLGRIDPAFSSHPNVAWELTNDPRFDVRYGTFEQLLHEIAADGLPVTCISAEDFDTLHLHQGAIEHLASGFRAIGYEPKIIAYLRPQVDYCESLYAELVKGGWRITLSDLIRDMFSQTPTYAARFDYDEMLRKFSAEFAEDAVMVRPYRRIADNDRLLRDFVGIVAGDVVARCFEHFSRPHRLNERETFGGVYAATARTLGLRDELDDVEIATGAFEPLLLRDVVAIQQRYWAGNERVARTYGTRVPCISWERLVNLFREVLGLDEISLRRKIWFRNLRGGERPGVALGKPTKSAAR